MTNSLFYGAALAFGLGILLQIWWEPPFSVSLWLLVLSLALALVWRRRSEASAAPHVLLGSVLLLCAALGALRLLWAETTFVDSPHESQVGQNITIEGVVVREPDTRERSTQLFVDTDEEIILVRADRYIGVEYGDRIRATGRLEAPSVFETDLGRVFNYPGYLKAQGVVHVMSFAEIKVVDRKEGNWFVTVLFSFKQQFMERLESVLPEPHVGLAEGLLLGVKTGLGETLEAAFRSTGIIHIVVLSGYNVMIVITFVLYGLAFILPFRGRLLVGLSAIVCFALLVGLSATVVRASVMAGLLLTAKLIGRTYVVLRGLALAGVIMLVFNPYLIAYDVGFQLSFMATLGLIMLSPWIEARLVRIPNNFLKTREFLTATVATQLFITPLLLYQIGEFSVVAVIVNVLVLPMVPVAMLLTFLTGMIAFVSSSLAALIAYPTYLSLAYIITLAEGFAALPFASYVVPAFPFWIVPVCYLFMGYLVWRMYDPALGGIYGDLAEGWIDGVTEKDGVSTSITNTVSGWIIEEEETVRARLTPRPQPQNEIPIFFR